MKSLIGKKNVVGVARGEKWTNGKPTGKDAILVFVEKKEPLSKLKRRDRIEKEINGVPTDVVGKTGVIRINKVYSTNPRKRRRPIMSGTSTGHGKITAGTLGGFFRDKRKDVVILSNCHILANSNQAHAGDAIYQPGNYDQRRRPQNIIGYLKDFVQLTNGINQDSAIAKIKVAYTPYINGIGRPRGIANVKVRSKVFKSGRTTGVTRGRVIAINGRFRVWYTNRRSYIINNCIVTTCMSGGGDSGSLLLTGKKKVAGLLFAGSDTVTLYNPIHPILRRYKLSLIR